MPIRKNDYVVCRLRHLYNMGCRNCIYNGIPCETFRKNHNGLNPSDYHDKLVQQNKIKEE